MKKAKLTFSDQTLREIVDVSIGGSLVRVRLSNAHGKEAVHIGTAHIALRQAGPNLFPHEQVSAEDIIAGLKQLIERAHENGIKIYGGTLTPFAGYFSEAKEAKRKAIGSAPPERSTPLLTSRRPCKTPQIPAT